MPSSGAWDLVIGILLAVVAGTVLPFVTAQATSIIQARRDRNARIRVLYEDVLRLTSQAPVVKDEWSKGSTRDEAVHEENMRARMVLQNEKQAARAALFSWFALEDEPVRTLTTMRWATYASTREDRQAMMLWASGRRRAARRLARRELAKRAVNGEPPTSQSPSQD